MEFKQLIKIEIPWKFHFVLSMYCLLQDGCTICRALEPGLNDAAITEVTATDCNAMVVWAAEYWNVYMAPIACFGSLKVEIEWNWWIMRVITPLSSTFCGCFCVFFWLVDDACACWWWLSNAFPGDPEGVADGSLGFSVRFVEHGPCLAKRTPRRLNHTWGSRAQDAVQGKAEMSKWGYPNIYLFFLKGNPLLGES